MAPTSFKLNTGASIPAVGLGTWQGTSTSIRDAVSHALQCGYRLIDTAYCYGNEADVGAGIRDAIAHGVRREDIFVVTKVWPTYLTRVPQALEMSLKLLGLDYVDLFLVHWPVLMNPDGNDEKFPTLPDGTRDVIHSYSHVDIWKNMEAAYAAGTAKAIGVSNYSKKYLEELLPHCKVVPAANQIENHPSLPQQEIVDLCNAKGIQVMAYSPLGSTGNPLFECEPVKKICAKKGVSPATVLLSYQVARGITVLPKSVTPARIKANLEIVDLDKEDMRVFTEYSEGLEKSGQLKRYIYPPFKTNFGFPDKQ